MVEIDERAYFKKGSCYVDPTIIRREGGVFEVLISKCYYQKEAVFAAAHSLTDTYRVHIKPAENEKVKIILVPMIEGSKANNQDAINFLMNRLIDEQVRLDLEKVYGKIRELIIEHAFFPLENLRAKVREITGRE
jgi:His-Xaa-Ser system protein HxsD